MAGSRYDVTNYRIEAQLNPDEHVLRAGADITFVPQDATRSVVFELNGSLHVDGVEKDGHALTGVVQDAVGAGALGPNVRIDLGQVVPAGQPATLRIRWSLSDVRVALVSVSRLCRRPRDLGNYGDRANRSPGGRNQ
ncbi:MAG: hypothetical protein DMF70_02855 [Acidobacteria bacterium]|nr:MAG: hypothetical protein DMF70_02855 [Acidobacteriota bacterium]